MESVWKSTELDNHHGGVILWEDHLYGSSFRGRWLCLDWKTGQVKYREKGVGKGSLCYADGMLYLFGERSGKAGLAAASPNGFELTGTVSVSGKGPSWAHPVVTGGRLYLRYDDNLYCFDVKDPTKTIAKPPVNVKTPVTKDPIVRPKPKPVTGEMKAEKQLRLADAYLRFGMKPKAADILRKLVADFPDSRAAKTATKKLQELSGGK